MFYTKTNPKKTPKNHLNVRTKHDYIEKMVNGSKTICRKESETDVYALTQSHAEEVKIDNIIKRLAVGDVRGLRQDAPHYIDLTGMPETYAEALGAIIQLEQTFNSLPIEVRREYNFSKEQFIADFGSEKFAAAIGITQITSGTNVPPIEEQIQVKE